MKKCTFHLLVIAAVLSLFGPVAHGEQKEVTILNLPPNGLAAAWQRGDIDAAFVWDPALSTIKKSGKVLITSGELGRWGKPTFDGMIADRKFSKCLSCFSGPKRW